MIVYIASCPEHGLHGERAECFVCGGPVVQEPMVPAAALAPLVDALAYLADRASWLGDPDAFGAALFGHSSPREVAAAALAAHGATKPDAVLTAFIEAKRGRS